MSSKKLTCEENKSSEQFTVSEKNKVSTGEDLKPVSDNRKRENEAKNDVVPSKCGKRTTRSTSSEEEKQHMDVLFNEYYQNRGNITLNSPLVTGNLVGTSPMKSKNGKDKPSEGNSNGSHKICTRSAANPTEKQQIDKIFDNYYKSKGSVVGDSPRKTPSKCSQSQLAGVTGQKRFTAVEGGQPSVDKKGKAVLPNAKTGKKNSASEI